MVTTRTGQLTTTAIGTPRLVADLLAAVRGTHRLDRLPHLPGNPGVTAREAVRTYSFRSPNGYPGVVTGLALDLLAEGVVVEDSHYGGALIIPCGAGCAYAYWPYVIPAGSVIEEVTR